MTSASRDSSGAGFCCCGGAALASSEMRDAKSPQNSQKLSRLKMKPCPGPLRHVIPVDREVQRSEPAVIDRP